MQPSINTLIEEINILLRSKNQKLTEIKNNYEVISNSEYSQVVLVKNDPSFIIKFYHDTFENKVTEKTKYERHLIALKTLQQKNIPPKLLFHGTITKFNTEFIITEFIGNKPEKIELYKILEAITKIRNININENSLPIITPNKYLSWVFSYVKIAEDFLAKTSVPDPVLRTIKNLTSLIKTHFSYPESILSNMLKTSRLSHGDLHKENILVDKNENYVFIDWDFASIAPIEFDVAMLCENFEAFNECYNTISIVEEFFNKALNWELIKKYRILINMINAVWSFNVLIRLSPQSIDENNLFTNPGFLEQYTMDRLKKVQSLLFTE